MSKPAAPKKAGARRFAFSAHGVINHYIACDLDEGILRYWPGQRMGDLVGLSISENQEERKTAREIERRHSESERCIGVELSTSQIERMEELLATERIEAMRGINDDLMAQRSGYFCYRDGWSTDFYAESDDGLPPLSLRHISYCSFLDDETSFEQLESYVLCEILGTSTTFPFDVAHKVPHDKTELIVQRALEVGIDAIYEVLWYGTTKLLKVLDEAEIPEPLSYHLSDDCFTIHYGASTLKVCKLREAPACSRVFGSTHVFSKRS